MTNTSIIKTMTETFNDTDSEYDYQGEDDIVDILIEDFSFDEHIDYTLELCGRAGVILTMDEIKNMEDGFKIRLYHVGMEDTINVVFDKAQNVFIGDGDLYYYFEDDGNGYARDDSYGGHYVYIKLDDLKKFRKVYDESYYDEDFINKYN
jgi:hypothetical protein